MEINTTFLCNFVWVKKEKKIVCSSSQKTANKMQNLSLKMADAFVILPSDNYSANGFALLHALFLINCFWSRRY